MKTLSKIKCEQLEDGKFEEKGVKKAVSKSSSKSVNEDMVLWAGILEGCEESFALLYQKYFKELYAYGYEVCQKRELVKDCIHDLFVHLWKKRNELKPVANVKYYLLVSVKRRLINNFNKSKKITFKDSILDSYRLVSLSKEREMIDHQTLETKKYRVTRALNLLTERQQKVLRLKFYDNCNNQEIAQKLSIDINSTYNLVSKALKRLRSNLSAF